MAYVDGFVLVVPTKKLKDYTKLAKLAGKVWMDHGAMAYWECVGDDLKHPFGVTFPKLVKLKASESVIFSFITYPSKASRNSINKKVMADARLAEMMDAKDMPFDMKRMSFGGFKSLVVY